MLLGRHILLLVCVAATGCGCNQSSEGGVGLLDSAALDPVSAVIDRPMPQLELLSFDSASIPAGCRTEGRVLDGARWRDAAGEHLLLVTWAARQGEYSSELVDLRGYHYELPADSPPRLLWKIHDRAENICDEGRGLVSRIEVIDIDVDGHAETAFVYNVDGPCDVSPVPYKLMLHRGATKLAVRGTTRIDLGDGEPMGGEKNFDAAFDAEAQEFREYASQLWDRTVAQFDLRVSNRE
jgi:hypothetical protein